MIETDADRKDTIMVNLRKAPVTRDRGDIATHLNPLHLPYSDTAPIMWLPRGQRRLPRFELRGKVTR